tara:strand:+ start:176 stop:820 length:645 start_codon:yes stop_codon:yes gene_type:complete
MQTEIQKTEVETQAIVIDLNSAEGRVTEGKALLMLWTGIEAKLQKEFRKSCKAESFDRRLGALLLRLKDGDTSAKLDGKILREHSLSSIDKRRRSEACWLEENISSEAAQKILKGSKRGFTSITAFKKAVDNSIEDAKETPKGSEGPTLDQPTTEGGMQEEPTEGGKAIVSVLAEATTEEVVLMLSECFSEAKLLEIAKQLSLLVSKDDLQKAA